MTVPILTESPAWKILKNHYQEIKDVHLRDLFKQDDGRNKKFTIEAVGLYMDFSKHRITEETINLLTNLASERGLEEKREAMFQGERINLTENRAVLHTALRAPEEFAYFCW